MSESGARVFRSAFFEIEFGPKPTLIDYLPPVDPRDARASFVEMPRAPETPEERELQEEMRLNALAVDDPLSYEREISDMLGH